MPKKQIVDIGGYKVKLSNLDKILFPNAKIIKAEVIHYYLEIAPWFLKFAQSRPLTMIRFPDGIFAHQFYSKNAPDWRPKWMKTYQLTGDDINYITPHGAQDIVWLANMASLENHAMNKAVTNDELMMDHVIFDLDPPESFDYCELRDLTVDIAHFLREKGLHTFVKTSGSRGAHIYLPIIPTRDFSAVIKEVKLLAKTINKAFPERTTNFFRKEKRGGKILLDINRNFEAQTTILPFSTRARVGAPVSMPLHWDDFKKTTSSQDYTIKTAKKYIDKNGYAWEDFYKKQVNFCSVLTVNGNIDQVKEKEVQLRGNSESDGITRMINVDKQPEWFDVPSFKPMLAGVSRELIESENLVYENKWDGIRVFVYCHLGLCKIMSRSGRNITKSFPEVVEIVENAKYQSVVFDGELIVPDERGRPIFPRVISRLHSHDNLSKQMKRNPVLFYVFDVVMAEGKELFHKEWLARRTILKAELSYFKGFKLSEALNEGDLLLAAAKEMNMEGIMMKDIHGRYTEGKRSDSWLKLKFRSEATCFILGFTAGEGDRIGYFGALHIAEQVDDEVVYRGKVGTGFNTKSLKAFQKLFDVLPQGKKWIKNKVDDEKGTIWFTKQLPLCEVQYASLTGSNTFREPVFKKMEELIIEVSTLKMK